MSSNITTSPSPQASPLSDGPMSLLLNILPWIKISITEISPTTGRPYAVTAITVLLSTIGAFIFFTLFYSDPSNSTWESNTHFPTITPPKRFRFDIAKFRSTRDFLSHGFNHLVTASREFGADKPFRMETDSGEATVLPSQKYANEVKSDARLSFTGPLKKAMHAQLRGFDIFIRGGMDTHLVVDVVRQDLTRELGKVTGPLNEETSFVLNFLLGESTEWKEIKVMSFVQEMVARLSSKVFLGDDLCRNREWLDLTVSFTVTSMMAAGFVRLFPWFLRPLANEVLPICRKMRKGQRKARNLIIPIVEKRRALRAHLLSTGASDADLKAAIKNDGIEWFERMSHREPQRPYDPHLAQLTLSAAAIHTTSDLLTQMILDLAQHPEMFAPLRQEIITVLGTQGWKKTSLYGLKLLDSCIRETQRLKPIAAASMRREVLEDITLSDGTFLRKGSQIILSGLSHWDPTVYTNPNEWDGYRFYRCQEQQQQQQQTAAVTTSADHLAFGHGAHACPGRFFAINEAKIALAHLIMKYEWELISGDKEAKPKSRIVGLTVVADLEARVRVRRRRAEIDLDGLEVA